jgi:hypothetical protein
LLHHVFLFFLGKKSTWSVHVFLQKRERLITFSVHHVCLPVSLIPVSTGIGVRASAHSCFEYRSSLVINAGPKNSLSLYISLSLSHFISL